MTNAAHATLDNCDSNGSRANHRNHWPGEYDDSLSLHSQIIGGCLKFDNEQGAFVRVRPEGVDCHQVGKQKLFETNMEGHSLERIRDYTLWCIMQRDKAGLG
jgi:hypothetical protein